jgi:excisionase family DNA binding protein
MSDLKFLTRKEVASLLRVSVLSIDRWAASGLLPRVKICGRVLFSAEAVQHLVSSNATEGQA